MPGFDDSDAFDYSAALARALDAGVSVTLYYGKQDTACNYVGGLKMANASLAWGGAAALLPRRLADHIDEFGFVGHGTELLAKAWFRKEAVCGRGVNARFPECRELETICQSVFERSEYRFA